MGTGFAPARVTSLVVEDNKSDRQQIAQMLTSTEVFQPVFYDNYQKHPFMQRATEADIVSLDLEVENRRSQSLFVCRQLKAQNPDKSVVFFTSTPEDKEVLKQPINFVLGKSDEVWASYDRLLMMILVHDRSLSVLRDLVELSPDRGMLKKQHGEIREQLEPFISSLMSIQSVFRKENRTIARRYRKLSKILKRMHALGRDEDQVFFQLHKMQEPLLAFVHHELNELRKVDGIHVTEKLENEIQDLDQSISEKAESITDTRGFGERAIVYATDKVVGSLKTVSEYLSPDKPTEKAILPEVEEEPVQQSLYVNAWFPDYEDDQKLRLHLAAELRVNLDYFRRNHTESGAEIPSATTALLKGLKSVDVMVLCPYADIDPITQTLELPPRAGNFVTFSVIPRREGPLDLTVLLLLRNEPIFRTVFVCEAAQEANVLSA